MEEDRGEAEGGRGKCRRKKEEEEEHCRKEVNCDQHPPSLRPAVHLFRVVMSPQVERKIDMTAWN